MITNTSKNTLLFVQITTHFKEMIRVARLLKRDGKYNPIVFFVTKYEGWENDFNLCVEESIDCTIFFNINKIKAPFMLRAFYFFLVRPYRFSLRWSRRLLKRLFLLTFSALNFFINKVKRGFNAVASLLSVFVKLVFVKSRTNELGQHEVKIPKEQREYSSSIDNSGEDQSKKRTKISTPGFTIKNPEACAELLINLYKKIWVKFPMFLPGFSKNARKFKASITILLKEKDIKLIVLPEHNLFYFTQLLAFIAKKHNIPSVIVPFTIANTMEWSEAFYDVPSRSLKSPINRIFAYAFPQWINHYKERMLFLPLELVLIHEMFGITPKNPWLLNSGNIDFLAAESEAMTNYYIDAGIEKDHVRTIGALYNDELFSRLNDADILRSTLYQTLNLQSDKPLLLCALPPNQFFGRESLIDFTNYEESTRFILSALAQYAEQYHIVINLHPRIQLSTVDFIKEYPVHLYSGDITEIIPFSSIYVATCSATIRMAATCGIPVINYDLYQYHYDDYKDLDGVLTIFTRSEFCKTLNDLVTKSEYYEHVHNLQKTQSERWGKLDGKSGQNLLNELDLLFVEAV